MKTCQTCGVQYGQNGRSAKRWAASKFCSRVCHSKAMAVARWRGHQATYSCLNCGKVVTTNAFCASRRKYCSRECARFSPLRVATARRNLPRLSGPEHPRWRGGHPYGREWQALCRAVIQRQQGRCAACGSKPKKLDVHHVIPWRLMKKSKLVDLIGLCPGCHAALERRLDKLIREVTSAFLKEVADES